MNDSDLQAALDAVAADDAKALKRLLKADPALAKATLEHDGLTTRPRPTLLHRATTDTRVAAARVLIEHGADIDSTVDGCLSPLEMASWSPNGQIAELLIDNGADLELHTEHPPVEWAVIYQRRDIFKRLIAAGAKYDITHTLRLGMLPETRALLKADPSLANTETPYGLPLNLAVSKPGIFKLLLRHGADVHGSDSFGLTPLKAARIPESDKVVQALLEMGVEDDIYGALVARDEAKVAAILQADPNQAHPVKSWPQRGPIPPVLWAIWSGSTRILELILAQEVQLDIRPNPLNTAIAYDYDEMVRMLLDHGASPECEDLTDWPGALEYPPYRPLSPPPRPKVHVPLYRALRGGSSPAVIDMLIDAGADPNSTLTGWAGLQWPARGGNLLQVKHLASRGADLRSPCAEEALRLAARQCKPAMVEYLIAHGAEVETTDDDGKTPLDLVGKTDSRPTRDERDRTRAVLAELIVISRKPKGERDRLLGLRAELLDAVIDGDRGPLRTLRTEAPGLFERELVTVELCDYAARLGHGEIVDWLVEQGAEMTISVATALGRVELVESMLDAEPSLLEGPLPHEVTARKKHLPWHEHSPLVIAARHDHTEIAKLLLDRGAEIDRRVGWYQNTALHTAVSSHSTKTVELLLDRGADVTIRSRDHHLPTAMVKNTPPTLSRRRIRDMLIAAGARAEEGLPHWVVE